MTWLQKLMPARIRTQGGNKRNVPEGLWGKCEGCGAVLYQPEVESNQRVCPKCGFQYGVKTGSAAGKAFKFLVILVILGGIAWAIWTYVLPKLGF